MKVAIIECHDQRGEQIQELVNRTFPEAKTKIYPIHKEIYPSTGYDAYIISGGFIRVRYKEKYTYLKKVQELIKELAELNKPILGICLGQQLIVDAYGGLVSEAEELEIGFQEIEVTKENNITNELPKKFYAFNYHWDIIERIPDGFESYAKSKLFKNHIIKHKNKPVYGIQFHIEYDQEYSKKILEYLKDEIEEEKLNYKELIKNTSRYSEETSKKIIVDFLSSV